MDSNEHPLRSSKPDPSSPPPLLPPKAEAMLRRDEGATAYMFNENNDNECYMRRAEGRHEFISEDRRRICLEELLKELEKSLTRNPPNTSRKESEALIDQAKAEAKEVWTTVLKPEPPKVK